MQRLLPRAYYRLIMIILILVSLSALWMLNERILSNATYIPVDDFSHYWAAGRLILDGENAYDADLVQNVRNTTIGEPSEYDVIPIMWAPPWTIPLVLPFSLLPYPIARLAWLLFNIACILIGSDFLWRFYRGDRKYFWLVWLCVFTFGPTISALQKGQPTPIILVGIIGFLIHIQNNERQTTRHDLVAGLFASLITIKPQLYYLFWPFLFFWFLQTRRWAVLAGAISGVIAGLVISTMFNASIIPQYIESVHTNPPVAWATPTIGGYLRLLFGVENFWLQFAPPILGLGLGATYWVWRVRIQNGLAWDWCKETSILLFGSLLTAAYAWTYDQVILLPALLLLLAQAVRHAPGSRFLWGLLATLTLINLADLLLHRWYDEFWFGWLAPAYLAWVWLGGLALRKRQQRETDHKTQASNT
jgi:hypothetical protein